MIELPEAYNLANQLDEAFTGKKIIYVKAAAHPHKFAWYTGEPESYPDKILNTEVTGTDTWAAKVCLNLSNGLALVFGDGTNLKYLDKDDKRPDKHQLLLEFNDGSGLAASIRMYGFIFLEDPNNITNNYSISSMKTPNPYKPEFNEDYFINMYNEHKTSKLSTKAFLATEQRIPGLGNGVLQDILFNARIHPAKKLKDFSEEDPYNLYNSIVITLEQMKAGGGRSTEKDLYGNPGGYSQILSSKTAGLECPVCGEIIEKKSYMGGSVYFCRECQEL